MDEHGSVIARIVAVLGHAQGVDPRNVEPPLHETIDPEALELLARHDGSDWRVQFDVGDHRVTVAGSDGTTVEVD